MNPSAKIPIVIEAASLSPIVRFEFKRVSAAIQGHPALFNVNLSLSFDKPTALLGSNGSGKSSLLKLIAGSPDVSISSGTVVAVCEDGSSIDWLSLDAQTRALRGVFLGWQHPPALPGLAMRHYLRAILNAHRHSVGATPLDPFDFTDLAEAACHTLSIPLSFLERDVHVGFSGGELKKSELLQAHLLRPDWFLADELESGVDVDSQKILLNFWKARAAGSKGLLVVSHQFELLTQIPFQQVVVLSGGRVAYDADSIDFQALSSLGFSAFLEAHPQS